MILSDFTPFEGEHCETVALGNLLKHNGVSLSEPMLFGLGSGLGYIHWKMRTLPLPFIGGRSKHLARALVENLGITANVRETRSERSAWNHVTDSIESGQPVALQLDCFHLPYFTRKIHFAGHHVALYGYDDHTAYLVDTRQQGSCVTCSLEQLARARRERGPMAARNKSTTLTVDANRMALESAIESAISRNAAEYLNPPIRNMGYQGIVKTAESLPHWYAACAEPSVDLARAAMLMERAGTGGALFRNLYRDFLREAHHLLDNPALGAAHDQFVDIAVGWTRVATLIDDAATSGSAEPLHSASQHLLELAIREREAMQQLSCAF